MNSAQAAKMTGVERLQKIEGFRPPNFADEDAIWPVPQGHQSGFAQPKVVPRHRVDLSDLLSAGWLHPGISLFPRRKKYAAFVAKLLADGRIDLNGKVFSSPSEAAKSIRGKNTNGWDFFLVDAAEKPKLAEVRRSYLESFAIEGDDDADDDEGDDEA